VFQRPDRYEAMMSVRNDFSDNLASVVPDDESERPSVAVLWGGDEPEQFSPSLINDATSYRQLRDLQVTDALAETDVQDFYDSRGQVGDETLLQIDPDVLLVRGHEEETRSAFENSVVSFMESDDTASELTAVQNGDVYRGGPLYQGPITNMVVAQRQARQLYDAEGDLLDRERVGATSHRRTTRPRPSPSRSWPITAGTPTVASSRRSMPRTGERSSAPSTSRASTTFETNGSAASPADRNSSPSSPWCWHRTPTCAYSTSRRRIWTSTTNCA